MIDRRISGLFCNKKEYDETKEVHEEALNKSNVKITLNVNKKKVKERRKTENERCLIYHIMRVYRQVLVDISESLSESISQGTTKLSKIFNRNVIDLSYNCTTNMKNLIRQHNSETLRESFKI